MTYSFPVPTTAAFDEPTRCVRINPEWIPFLLGALESLLIPPQWGLDERNGITMKNPPSVWDGDAEFADQQIQKIMSAFADGNCEEMVMTIPTGTIAPYIGTDSPDGWLQCNGATYNQVDYPALVAKLPASLKDDVAGTFTTPDFQGRMPLGSSTDDPLFGLATTGGEHQHALTVDELPSHTHIQNAHNHTQNSHNHTQNPHGHTTQPHTHVQNSHTHGQAAHGHTVESRQSATGLGTGALAASNGIPTHLAPTTEVAPTIFGATAVNQNATVTVDNATATNNATTATNNATTAVNQNTGNNLAHNNMPPYFVTNFIIKT